MMPRELILRTIIIALAVYANVFTLNADTYDIPNEVLRIEFYSKAARREYIISNYMLTISKILSKSESEPLEQIELTQQGYNKLIELASIADKCCQQDQYYNPLVSSGDTVRIFLPSKRTKGLREISICNTYNKALIEITQEIDKIVSSKYKIEYFNYLKKLFERGKTWDLDTSPIGLPE